MLTIRLTRKGKKNQPFFRVVLVDKRRSSKSGQAIEDLGFKNPLTKKISLNKDRILYWLKNGAKPSETIHNLLIQEKIIEAKKLHVSKLSKKKQSEIDKAKADAEAAAKAKAEAEAKAKEEAKAAAETPKELPAEEAQPSPEAPAGEAKSEETPAA